MRRPLPARPREEEAEGAMGTMTLKGPGSSGALRMTEDKFTFTPDDPPSLMKLTVDFRSIKGHKCNKVDDSKPAEPLLNLLRKRNAPIKGVDRTLDMFLKDDYLHLADHGLLYDGSGETTDTDCELAWRTLSQDLNRHAAVVLEGRSIDIKSTDAKTVAEALARSRKEPPSSSVADDVSHEKLVKVSRTTEIEDLQVPRSLQYAPLCIKNTREYFDSQQANALRSSGDNNDDAFRHLMDQISSVKLNCPFVQSDVALKVLNELNEGISRSWRLNLKNSQDGLLGRLLHRTRDELMDVLLRQFWSSYPITTAALSNKVQRVLDAMSQIYQKLQDMKESAQPDVRHDVSRLVKPMIQALDAAFNHDLDQQEKSSKAPTGFEQRTLHP